jgi:hypothetical protein
MKEPIVRWIGWRILRIVWVATIVGWYLIWLGMYLNITSIGLNTGHFSTVLRTNDFGEHWFELGLLLFGLPGLCFIMYDAVTR